MKFAAVLLSAALSATLFAACATPAFAHTGKQYFACGAAQVRIDIIARDALQWEDRVESVVTVSKDGYSTVLRYRNIDFIGGQCVAKPGAAPLVVFQAYCGGSGCKDLDNWGVIETDQLRVLTVPSDTNREDARRIIGSDRLPQLDMLAVDIGPPARQSSSQ